MMTRALIVSNVGFSFASCALEAVQAQKYGSCPGACAIRKKKMTLGDEGGCNTPCNISFSSSFLPADCAETHSAGALLWQQSCRSLRVREVASRTWGYTTTRTVR